MNFWLITTLFTLICITILLLPILRPRKLRTNQNDLNIAIYEQQLKELTEDVELGVISSADHEQAKTDIELTLAGGINPDNTKAVTNNKTIALLVIILLVPAISIATYLNVGSYNTGDTTSMHKNQPQTSLDEMVATLEQKLTEKPDNVEGWLMLARSYDYMGRKQDVVRSYRQARKYSNDDPWILSELGFALLKMTGSLAGEPIQLLKQALTKDANNQNALFLVGKYNFDQGKYQAAIDVWQQLLKLTNEKDAKPVRQMLSQAKAKLGLPVEIEEKVENARQILLQVNASEEIKAKFDKSTSVFIYAQATTGPKMPLAATKIKLSDLPAKVKLDDSMALNPNMKLSSFDTITVSARIAKSGLATRQSGDYIGSKDLTEFNQEIELIIDTEIP